VSRYVSAMVVIEVATFVCVVDGVTRPGGEGRNGVDVIRLDDWRELEEEFVIEPVPMPMPDSLSRVVGRREDAT